MSESSIDKKNSFQKQKNYYFLLIIILLLEIYNIQTCFSLNVSATDNPLVLLSFIADAAPCESCPLGDGVGDNGVLLTSFLLSIFSSDGNI